MTTEKIVPDAETDKQIIVARILRWRGYREESSKIHRMFDAIGFGDYVPDPEKSFTVDLSQLVASLPDRAEIKLQVVDGIADPYNVVALVRSQVDGLMSKYSRLIHNGEVAVEPLMVESRAVDVDAVLAEWGGNDTSFPKASTPELDTARHRLVRTVLRHGIDFDFCRELEAAISEIGLSEYLPPDTQEVTVDIPGLGPGTITAPLTRAGEIDRWEYRRAVKNHVIRELEERNLLEPPVIAA
ncbi:hypothetical protein [Nocardia niwae]|uniref:hypothetical protein n=1 Tax=Nocardia niwae TaxID=626084 RepID=UPI00340B3276